MSVEVMKSPFGSGMRSLYIENSTLMPLTHHLWGTRNLALFVFAVVTSFGFVMWVALQSSSLSIVHPQQSYVPLTASPLVEALS